MKLPEYLANWSRKLLYFGSFIQVNKGGLQILDKIADKLLCFGSFTHVDVMLEECSEFSKKMTDFWKVALDFSQW